MDECQALMPGNRTLEAAMAAAAALAGKNAEFNTGKAAWQSHHALIKHVFFHPCFIELRGSMAVASQARNYLCRSLLFSIKGIKKLSYRGMDHIFVRLALRAGACKAWWGGAG